jgi:hypothetical protein
MKVVISNITRSKALELLENVQESVCKGFAIGGKKMYEHIFSDTVFAYIAPKTQYEDGSDMESPDFTSYTFTIQSNYWLEFILKEYAGL